MKKKIAGIVLLVAGLSFAAQAASDSWNQDTGSSWWTAGNWLGGNVPGESNGTANADIATFSYTLTAPRTVTVDDTRNIGGITFGNTSTNGYTIGTSAQTIRLSNGGVIQIIAGTGKHNDKFNSPIEIQGDGGTAAFRNNSTSTTGGGLQIAGAVSGVSSSGNTTTLYLDGSSTSTANSPPANQVSGAISDGTAGGKLAVVKNDAGAWILTGNNTFTGGLNVNSGTIRYFGGGNTVFGRGLLTISNGVTFNKGNNSLCILSNQVLVKGDFSLIGAVNSNAWSGAWDLDSGVRTITVSGSNAISGTISNGGLVKAGTEVLVLSGSNTYSGATTVSAGTLIANADSALGTSNVTIAGGATLTLTGGTANNYVADTAAVKLATNASLNLNFTGTDTIGYLSLDDGAVWLPPATYDTVALTNNGGKGTYTGTGSLTVQYSYYSLTVNGGTGGGGYNNGAEVTITATPSAWQVFDHWSGDTQHVANILSSTTTVTMPATNVSLTAVFTDAPSASDSWKTDASGNWNATSNWTDGNIPGSTNSTASTNVATFNVTLTTNRTVTVDTNRNIGGITFGNTSTYGYTLSSGNLELSSGGLIQTLAGAGAHDDVISSPVMITGDGGTATFLNSVSGGGTGLKFTGAISGSSTTGNTTTLTLDGTGTSANNWLSATVSDGTLSGKLALIKNGTGWWSLTGNNTFTGGLVFNEGTIRYFGTGTVFGRGLLTIGDGAIFNHANGSPTIVSNQMLVNGNFSMIGNTNTQWGGTMDLSAGTRTITVSVDSAFASIISNGGLNKAGTNSLTLRGTNTYAGATVVSSGTLIGAADGALGHGNVTVAGGATLTLTNGVLNDYIKNSASLILGAGSVLNLGFDGTDTVAGISIDGTNLAANTYTAAELVSAGLAGAAGTGSLTIGGAGSYLLTGSVTGGNGTVTPSSTNVPAGGNVNFTVTASSYYRIDTLATNGTPVGAFDNNSASANFLWSNVQSTGALVATFIPQVTTNAPVQVPYAWLAGYGITNNQDAAAVLDPDSDGLKTWQEYIANTDPTNALSCLKAAQTARNTVTWTAQSNRIYSVYWSTNLVKGFTNLNNNITLPQSSYTNTNPDSRVNHYQVRVRMP